MSETTRVRQSGVIKNSSALHRIFTYTWPNPTPVVTFPSTAMVQAGHDTVVMTDVVTPGFAVLQSQGRIFNNPMKRVASTYTRGSGNVMWTKTHPQPVQSHQDYDLSGNLIALWEGKGLIAKIDGIIAPQLSESNSAKLAGIKARNRISPIQVQSLVSAVELPKTLELIKSGVSTILGLRKAILRGDLNSALRVLGNQRSKRISTTSAAFAKQSLSQRWLELRYGWTPLMYDIQGTVEALSRTKVRNLRATARGKSVAKRETFNDSTWVSNSGLGNLTFRLTLTEEIETRAYILYTADLEHQLARDFGVTELPLAAWELVPFSFVVDWFVNIGNWIDALTPKLGVTILAEGYTSKTTVTYSRKLQQWTKVFFGSEAWDLSGDWSITPDILTVITKKRVPTLDVLYSYPPLDVSLNKKRVLDAISLLQRSK